MITHFPYRALLAALFAIGLSSATAHAEVTHRYSFNEKDQAKDSVGKVDGKLIGGASIADGKLVLKSEDKASSDDTVQHVQFEQSILPKGDSVTLMAWFTASEVGPFARILNIGDKEGTESRAFIYFTPRNADDLSRAAISATDAASKTSQDNDRLDDNKPHMVALVIDGKAKKLHVFIDGKEPKPAEDLGDNTLDKIRPTKCYLGRSTFDQDPGLTGSIDEFRVYDNALSADEVKAAADAGPDQLSTSSAPPAKAS